MQCDHLPAAVLHHDKEAGVETREIHRVADDATGEIRESAIDSTSQLGQCVGAAAVLLGEMQIAGDLEHHGGLVRQGSRPANIFLRNSGAIEPVEYPEHAQ